MECLDNNVVDLEHKLVQAKRLNRVYRARIRTLTRQHYTDRLTNCLSKQGIELFGSKMVAHAARAGELVSVVFMDIDRFKALNDVHGHAAGDAILQYFATCLRVREEDVCGRLQGDEFVACLRGGLVAATMFVSRLRSAVEATNTYAVSRGYSSISLSIGCVVLDASCAHRYWAGSEEAKLHLIDWCPAQSQFSQLLHLADCCMHVSKLKRNAGR